MLGGAGFAATGTVIGLMKRESCVRIFQEDLTHRARIGRAGTGLHKALSWTTTQNP